MSFWANPQKEEKCPRCHGTGHEGSGGHRICGVCRGAGKVKKV